MADTLLELGKELGPQLIEKVAGKLQANLRGHLGDRTPDLETIKEEHAAEIAQFAMLQDAAEKFSKTESHYGYRAIGFGEPAEDMANLLAEIKVRELGGTAMVDEEEEARIKDFFLYRVHGIMMERQPTDNVRATVFFVKRLRGLVKNKSLAEIIKFDGRYHERAAYVLKNLVQAPGAFELAQARRMLEGKIKHSALPTDMKKDLSWYGEMGRDGRVKHAGSGFNLGANTLDAVNQTMLTYARETAAHIGMHAHH